MKLLTSILFISLASVTLGGAATTKMPVVIMKTNQGTIVLELNAEKAPITVKNFLDYVEAGLYDGTIFHRIIGNFMIQGGGFTEDYKQKKTKAPIKNEAINGLANKVGTIAMARTNHPHSATNQFFINVVNNDFLNYSPANPGYAVFGKVIEGMSVVEKIKGAKTGAGGPFPSDVPQEPIIIESITIQK